MNPSKKVYQENSYLTTLEAEVLSCNKINDLYEVILDKTIFYPHMSGGQPKDKGTINGIEVSNVIENGEKIIHVISEPLNGTVSLEIDFETRFDYMQQHTGQHILSCTFDDLYNGKTIGFHLSSDSTTIDLDINLTDNMLERVEIYANQIIYDNINITAQTLPYNDALKLNLRKTPPKLDFLRILEIHNKDIIACGGTHVKSTGEIGVIKIVKVEKYKTGVRVEFLCGKRALNDYILRHRDIMKLSALLTCKADMIFDNFNKIKIENKELKKNIISQQNEINDYKAEELKNNVLLKNNIKYIFQKLDVTDIKDLRFICSKAIQGKDYVAVLICETNTTCSICLGQSDNLNFDIKGIFEQCKKIINAHGGGNNKLIQGTGNILNKSEECINIAKSLLII